MRTWSSNVDEIIADFDGIERRSLDVSPAWDGLVDWYTFTAERRFASARWKPLSKRYARRKARTHPGKRILMRTGALHRGMTSPEVRELGPDSALVGIRTGVGRAPLFYAQWAQEGRGQPQRTLMPRLPRIAIEEITGDIAQHILGGRR